MVAAILERGGHAARPQPRRGEHGRRRGERAARRAAARPTATRACSRSTSSGSTASSPELRPRALLLANLFRDQLDRYGELETIADRWAAVGRRGAGTQLVLNADDPLVADLGRAERRRRDAARHVLRRRGRRASRCRACRTRRTPSTAAAAARRTSTTPSTSATSAATTARTATRAAPEPGRRRRATIVLDGTRGARFTLRTPAGAARRRASPSPASTTSTTRSAPPRSTLRARRAARRRRRRAARPSQAAFGRAETVQIARPRARRSCSSRTRRAPTRSCARSRSTPASTTCSASSTTAPPTAATSPGCGTPTSRSLAPRVRRVTCSGTRAAELALRLKYAGVPPERLARRARPRPRRSTRALAGGDGRLVALPDLHRDARAARAARRAAAPPRGRSRERTSIWHDVECGAYDADLPLWRELAADAPAARSSTSARAPAASTLDLARARARGRRARRRRRRCSPRCASARGDLPVETARRRRARLRPRRARFGAGHRADADVQLLGGADGRAGFLRCGPRATCARAACSPRARRRARGVRRRATSRRRCPTCASVDGVVLRQPAGRGARRRRPGASIERVRETVVADGRASARRATTSSASTASTPTQLEAEGARRRPAARAARA